MSHIAIDAREYSSSTGRYISSLLTYLQQIDTINKYTVLLQPKDLDSAPISAPNFTKVATPYKAFTFGEQLGFNRQLKQLHADLVHFGMTQQPVLYRGRTVTTVHDLTTARFTNPDKQPVVFKIKQQVYRWVIKKVARKANHLITPTAYVQHDLATYAHINPAKITVTLEAADAITEPAEPLANLENKQFIMYVGRPTPHKNLPRLIEAYREVSAQHPGLQLVLAGKLDNNYRALQAELAQSKQNTNIIFTDFVAEGQLRWLYEHCAAYIFPSLSEGFGLPGLEAMVHGAPVVSSNATCLPEVYGEAAHYFDPLDITSMADAINEVLTDEQLRQRLIQAGHIQAAHYSWRRMAEQTLEVYSQALAD